MKKKVTQETANRLRELLEKVISEREDAAPLPKEHQIARILVPLFALCFAGVYLQNAHAFKKEFNALVERAKEEIALGKKKPLETNRTLVKGLEGFLKTLQTEYQFEQKIR